MEQTEDLKEKFIQDLLSKDPAKLVSLWLLERVPYIFEDNRELFIDWKLKFAKKINIDSNSILLVGSSCVGLSLNPYKNYRRFDDHSDVDVAVVSEYFFNVSWRFFKNLGAKRFSLTPKEIESIKDHEKKYVFWGTITTDNILPLLPFGPEWQRAISDMSGTYPINNRVLKIRLYKDFDSLRGYHESNLKKLRNDYFKQQGDVECQSTFKLPLEQ